MYSLKIIGYLVAMYVLAFPLQLIATNNNRIPPEELTRLSAKAVKDGHVRLIIGLRLPHPGFKPEGTLSPQEVIQQRDAIAAARKSLSSSLSGYDVEVYRIYSSIPSMAIKIEANGLNELVISPYVTSIQEDQALPPHSNDSSVEEKERKTQQEEVLKHNNFQ